MATTIYNQNFGVEIELTGITRRRAANVIAKYFGRDSWYGVHSCSSSRSSFNSLLSSSHGGSFMQAYMMMPAITANSTYARMPKNVTSLI